MPMNEYVSILIWCKIDTKDGKLFCKQTGVEIKTVSVQLFFCSRRADLDVAIPPS